MLAVHVTFTLSIHRGDSDYPRPRPWSTHAHGCPSQNDPQQASRAAPGLKRSGGRGYLKCIEYCAQGVINAAEQNDVHDAVGPEQRFSFAVELLAEPMAVR